MDLRDSLQLIEMDKGGEGLGPLFEEPRRRLQDEPSFRSAWSQYQAVKALAWEAAPELDERLVRQALQASRRQEVERRLARATGSQDAARELLLKPEAKSTGLPVWVAFLLLVGALGLGWLAFGPGTASAPDRSLTPLPTPVDGGALAFEFPVSGSASAGENLGAPPIADEVKGEDEATRKARRLVNENLRAAAEPKPAPTVAPTPKPRSKALPHPAPTRPVPRPTATLAPTAQPTAVSAAEPELQATTVPTALPTHAAEQPTAVPSAPAPHSAGFEALGAASGEASLSLSGSEFPALATLNLPEAGAVDLRLFDMRGRLVRRYAEGEQAAGRWKLALDAHDDQGQALSPGNYYLRAITRWFSKVEAIDQR